MKHLTSQSHLPLISIKKQHITNPYLPQNIIGQKQKPLTALEKFVTSRKSAAESTATRKSRASEGDSKSYIPTLDGVDVDLPVPNQQSEKPSNKDVASKLPDIQWKFQYRARKLPSTPDTLFMDSVLKSTEQFFSSEKSNSQNEPKTERLAQLKVRNVLEGLKNENEAPSNSKLQQSIVKQYGNNNVAALPVNKMDALGLNPALHEEFCGTSLKRSTLLGQKSIIVANKESNFFSPSNDDLSLHARYLNSIINAYSKFKKYI